MRAVIRNKTIQIGKKEIEFSSLFSMKTIEKSNHCADNYYQDICIVNELYEEFVLPFFDAEMFVWNNSVSEIEVQNVDEELLPVILCVCNRNNIHIIGNETSDRRFWMTKANKMGAFVYLFLQQLKQKYNPINIPKNAIVFSRSKSVRQKFERMHNVDKLNEISPGVGNMFQQIKIYKRILLLFKAIKLTKKYEADLLGYLSNYEMLDCIPFSKYYYSRRLIHTAYYYLVQDYILKNGTWKILYTGNNLDRFAYNEEFLAKKYGMKLICVPHGIEYGYKFPKCFVGDHFYTTSKNAARELNRLYNTKKFQFSAEIGETMFKTDGNNEENIRIVYFSEPREVEVNIEILKELAITLSKKRMKLYLKLHPVDHWDNYKEIFALGVKEISDFREAIHGNICVARKSTVLLEATYNESVAVAILITEKDRCMFQSFPSLMDERIIRFYKIQKAGEYIIQTYKERCSWTEET